MGGRGSRSSTSATAGAKASAVDELRNVIAGAAGKRGKLERELTAEANDAIAMVDAGRVGDALDSYGFRQLRDAIGFLNKGTTLDKIDVFMDPDLHAGAPKELGGEWLDVKSMGMNGYRMLRFAGYSLNEVAALVDFEGILRRSAE